MNLSRNLTVIFAKTLLFARCYQRIPVSLDPLDLNRLTGDHIGHPRTPAQALGLDFIGVDRHGRYLEHLTQHGLPLSPKQFRVLSENSVTSWMLVQQGLGIGIMMDEIAQRTAGVVRVLDDVASVRFPVWLVTHRELRTARRIRIVFDALAQALTPAPDAPSNDI